MMLRGFVKDGVVVPYDPSGLVEGAEVDFSLREGAAARRGKRQVAKKAKGPLATGKKKGLVPPPKASRKKRASKRKPLTLREVLEKYTGAFDGLPSDMARNHDHYLHGKPKKP